MPNSTANSVPSFIINDRLITREKFAAFMEVYRPLVVEHSRIVVHTDDPIFLNVLLILCRTLKKELFACHAYFKEDDVESLVSKYSADLLLTRLMSTGMERALKLKKEPIPDGEGCLYVFTSGTTGEAKIARHCWHKIALSADFVGERLKGKRWLLCYSPTSYAGLQVFFSAYQNAGTIYYPLGGYEQTAYDLSKYEIQIISATPTYWRLLMASWPSDLPRPRLVQATLGGEIVTQDILDAIRGFFKPEKLTQIYASTEAGTAIVVSDDRAGFPLDYLEDQSRVPLRIVDNVLEIKAHAGMEGYLNRESSVTSDGWVRTGDAVEIRGDRVYFLGRQDGMINVGGLKVLPEEVEAALTALEEIRDARVFAKKSPLVGAVVVAEVVMDPQIPFDEPGLKAKLKKRLPEYKIPRMIMPVEKIEISEHGKKRRF